jgi:hypothetical protein
MIRMVLGVGPLLAKEARNGAPVIGRIRAIESISTRMGFENSW